MSRRELKRAFAEQRVCVDGRPIRGSATARPGWVVSILASPEAGERVGEPPLEIVFSDSAVIVVEKPAGVPAYALRAAELGSVASAVLARFPDLAGVGDLRYAPGLCHRLDRETSGLLLFARTADVFAAVRAAFRARRVRKLYQAVVDGHLVGDGTIEVALGRRRGDARRMVTASNEARRHIRRTWPARTRWWTEAFGPDRTLVALLLETGVTHQARVHLASIGHPIVGDSLYGGSQHPRLLLHALELGLDHPTTGAPITWRSRCALSITS